MMLFMILIVKMPSFNIFSNDYDVEFKYIGVLTKCNEMRMKMKNIAYLCI